MSFTLAEVREHTYKKRDAWWTVLLVDPLAGRLVVWTANHTAITPNQLTAGAGVLGVASAVCLALGDWQWLVVGALLFHLSFVLDCMDGKIARLKGNGSVFGTWVDFVFDRVRFFACMMALFVGQWVATGAEIYLLLAPGVAFLDMLRYLNGAQVAKTRRGMARRRRRLTRRLNEATLGTAAPGGAGTAWAGSDVPAGASVPDQATGGTPAEPDRAGPQPERPELRPERPDLQPETVPPSPGRLDRLREALLRHRVRPHLFSGIEFEMFVCVVAPLTVLVTFATPLPSLVIPVTILAGVALLVFEVVLVYRLWRQARAFAREVEELEAALAAVTPEEPDTADPDGGAGEAPGAEAAGGSGDVPNPRTADTPHPTPHTARRPADPLTR